VDSGLNKHILVIAQYFYPEQFRINDICSEWVKRGYKVTVITGIPNYPQGKYYEGYGIFKKRKGIYNGIEIIRIPLIPRGNNSIMLALNYLSFVVSGFFWKVFTRIKADYVFIFEVSPMTQALPGIWYAKKRKIPCYLYVQDLWPENVEIITGITNKQIIGAIGKMVDNIYANCSKIFTTSNSFKKSISNRGVPIDKVEYWPQYAEDFYRPLERTKIYEIPKDDVFNITFAGNIGNAQGLDILPKAAIILKENLNKKIRFNIVGDGRYKEALVELVNKNNVSDMFNFIPKQPAIRIPAFMAVSDVAFLCLTNSPLFAMTIPAKLQSYMACGIPIIASADGETEQIITEAKAGLCCPAGDAQKLAEVIIELSSKSSEQLKQLGTKSREYYDRNFNKQQLLNKMDRYFGIKKYWRRNLMFTNKTLLITGGTGSFGNAVLKRFLNTDIGEIRIFSRDEKKQDDMRKLYNNDKIKFYLGNVRDLASVKNAMYGVDYIFHAAALKQVPSCEFFPLEAVKTNVLGTDNVLTVAIESGVKKVICLSTDKAAYPINAMGISKAMMEKVFVAKSKTVSPDKTVICGTRYGNVMASRGSVIPLFIDQIKNGQPLTITNPDMTRFLMDLDEAVELVIFAFENAEAGDIMVQKSQASTIRDLAQAVKELFHADNEIKIIGTRHGEKLYETLLTKEEYIHSEDMGGFFRVAADKRDLNYDKYFVEGSEKLSTEEEYNSHNTEILNVEQIKEKLLKLDYVKEELNLMQSINEAAATK